MKNLYSLVTSLTTFLYRKSGGRIAGKMRGGNVLLLTMTGRKTGQQRTVPLIYIMDGSDYILTASTGGAPKHPGWFFNLRANPQAVIQVKDRQFNVVAHVADQEKKRELWTRLVAALPFYEGFQRKTTRDIPMVILHPVDEHAS
jgi:deazaflavin-dependent oxidoreductase (nitroreductase family)